MRTPGGGPGMRVHRLVVDSYCLQHPASYCRSPKSMAAHLAGLCCGLEFGGHPKVYGALQRWLSGPREDLSRPTPPDGRAGTGVGDVRRSIGTSDFVATVERWAAEVWEHWRPHQPYARQCVQSAIGKR